MARLAAAICALAALLPAAAAAQRPDTGFGVRAPLLKRDTLRLPPLSPYVPSGIVLPPSPRDAGRRWEAALLARIAAVRAARWRAALIGAADGADTAAAPVLAAPAYVPPARTLARYADLGLSIDARFEIRLDRLKNERCTAADATRLDNSCRGGFPPPQLEPQFAARTGGIVGQRVHLNVDYDTEREFEASNNIQVYYEGLEDEILRRVEVGNVSFAAPNSRFISGGIPANNFGAAAQAQLGALSLGAIFAQQKGNVVKARSFTIGERTVQPQDRDLLDRDFEPLRFFFAVDPATLPGYPAVNVLAAAGLPPDARVSQVRVYRRRTFTGRGTAEQTLGGIEAVALRDDSPQRAGPFPWELLAEGRDYYLDPSGVWFALASRLDQEDYLAVSYVTLAGDTVGTFPAAARSGAVDTLRLIYEPRRGADVPTFRYEMRNAYRVGSVDDVLRESMQLRLLVAESERPDGAAPTFLSLLGMGQASDPNTFDQFNRLFPRQQDPGRGAPLRDFFVVFPHLEPFGDSAALSDAQFRNDSLYRTPAYLLRTQGPAPLFRLRLQYDATGGDDRRVLALGGFQIREGSERITAAGRQLTRGADYTVNYELGQVTFVNPDSLFPQPTTVAVQYEENPAFTIAPTSIYGMQARYDLGDHGSIGALGLLQRQRTTFTRPPLGFEPSSHFAGGLMGAFRFEPNGITRLLDALPLISTAAPSSFTLDAEIATSRPSPNQLGVAYVETFEDEGGMFIPLGEAEWQYGSRPSATGLAASGIGAGGFLDDDASLLVWQNFWGSGGGAVQFRAREIDPAIRVLGAGETVETVLWMTLQPDTIGGLWKSDTVISSPRWLLPHTPGPRWRSVTEALSSTGVDLTRTEFLEFWVYEDSARTAQNADVSLVFDFGTVYEDAVAFQPTGFTVSGSDTTFSGRRRAGEGRLDSERDSVTNAFNAAFDDTGILGDVADSITNLDLGTMVTDVPLCRYSLGRQLEVYPLGVDLARCTRNNGRADTEDLNNDQHLDSLISGVGENHLRHVMRLSEQRYFVRDGGRTAGGATWRLYRIPFRADTLQIGTPDLRQIRALRMTVIAPDLGQPERPIVLGLARMKLVGAPWIKRAGTPIAGLGGSRGEPHGEVVASVVSTENATDLGYEPPPGVTDAGTTQGGQFDPLARQINERSLRLIGSGVEPGERAEAFLRFPAGERNFLGYRELRVWARGRGPGWDERQLSFYVKVGQDENNFYLFRQPLSTATWEPEVVVAFQRWLALRARIEQAYLRGEPPSGGAACGGDTLAYVMCDGPYVVQVRNPGVAPPNLTRVQELAVGFVRDSGASVDSTEAWVDDIRLTQVVDDPGYAGAVTARLSAADVANFDVAVTRRDRNFRQLGESPTYETRNSLSAGGTVRLERLGLERLGIAAPLTVRLDRSSTEPYYLNRTDVEAAGLTDLREPSMRSSSYSLALRRTRRGTRWYQRALTDNLSFAGAWTNTRTTSQLARSAYSTSSARADYQLQPGARSFSYMPGFLRNLLGGLPGFLRNTEMVRGLERGRMRWTPSVVTMGADLTRSSAENVAFRAPIALPSDSENVPIGVTNRALRSRVSVDLQPFSTAVVGVTLLSDRDLRDYGDTTTMGRLANQNRKRLLGADVGFERSRQLSARLSYAPAVVSWLRPRLNMSSAFLLARDPNQAEPERAVGDTAGAFRLPTTFNNSRSVTVGGVFDWSSLLRGLLGDSSVLRGILDRLAQVDVSSRTERRSQFNRAGFDPGLGYQFGFGGLDDFRGQRDVLASLATELRERRVSSGLRLPLNLSMTGSYASLATVQWSLRGAQQQESRSDDTDWPNVTLQWRWTPRGGAMRILTNVTASATVRERRSETVQPALGSAPGDDAGAIRTNQTTRSMPLSVSLIWRYGVSTGFNMSRDRVEALRAGSSTSSERGQAGASLSFAFRTPQEYLPLPAPVRLALRYVSSDATSCIRHAGVGACIPIADSRRSEYTLLLDTDVPPNASASLSASRVVTEDVHANRKFSQFVLTAGVRILLQAGELR